MNSTQGTNTPLLAGWTLVVLCVVMAIASANGYGNAQKCGGWGALQCMMQALIWIAALGLPASLLLWIGISKTLQGTPLRYASVGIAVLVTVLAFCAAVVVFIIYCV